MLVIPKRTWLFSEGPNYNESAIQRGSLLTESFTGIQLTPFDAALPAWMVDQCRSTGPERDPIYMAFPVTSHPRCRLAKKFWRQMQDTSTRIMAGGLPFTYRLKAGQSLPVRGKVEPSHRFRFESNNVVGTLR